MSKMFFKFIEARNIARNLKIKSNSQWRHYCKSSVFNSKFPKVPDSYYVDKGWVSWNDFLGNCNKSPGLITQRKYKVNDNYFKKWSGDMAYILGLWFADGCITKGKFFQISQHKKDRYILEKILVKMKSNYPIKEGKNLCCSFCINSKEIYNDIIKLGGKERKSLDVKFPNVPKKYLPDFIRGLWDGDGSISSSKTTAGNLTGFLTSLCSASKDFIFKVEKILKKNIDGIKMTIYISKTPKGTVFFNGRKLSKDSIVYHLNLSPNNSKKLRDFMYSNKKNELRLVRKYDKFAMAGCFRPPPGTIKYMSFKDAKKLVSIKNFRGSIDYCNWLKILKNKKHNIILPTHPNYHYKEWTNWQDFLGHYRISYSKLSNMVKENGIANAKSYYRWIKSVRSKTYGRYPRNPDRAYKSEWQGWGKFLQKT